MKRVDKILKDIEELKSLKDEFNFSPHYALFQRLVKFFRSIDKSLTLRENTMKVLKEYRKLVNDISDITNSYIVSFPKGVLVVMLENRYPDRKLPNATFEKDKLVRDSFNLYIKTGGHYTLKRFGKHAFNNYQADFDIEEWEDFKAEIGPWMFYEEEEPYILNDELKKRVVEDILKKTKDVQSLASYIEKFDADYRITGSSKDATKMKPDELASHIVRILNHCPKTFYIDEKMGGDDIKKENEAAIAFARELYYVNLAARLFTRIKESYTLEEERKMLLDSLDKFEEEATTTFEGILNIIENKVKELKNA